MEEDYITIDVDVVRINNKSLWVLNLKDKVVTIPESLIELSHKGLVESETETTPYRANLPEWMAIDLELV